MFLERALTRGLAIAFDRCLGHSVFSRMVARAPRITKPAARGSAKLGLLGGLSIMAASGATVANAGAPPHYFLAEDLVLNINQARNTYGTNPHYILRPGMTNAYGTVVNDYENRTECNSFVILNLQQAYPTMTDAYVKTWMGSTSPTAAMIHDTIATANRFTILGLVTSLQPGDILAVKYPVGSSPSGHAMMVSRAPVARVASAPIVPGTVQYDTEILDSTALPVHGPTDSRALAGPNQTGAGMGTIRIYANAMTGAIAGYTWDDTAYSVYYPVHGVRDIVAGRLN